MKKQTLLGFGLLYLVGLFVGNIVANADESVRESNATITFQKNDESENPLNPTDPTIPVDPIDPDYPHTEGPLSIDYISNIAFGNQKATGNDTTYYALPDRNTQNSSNQPVDLPNYIQVTDNTGKNAGWTLFVKQGSPFTNGANTLTGTKLTFSNLVLKSPNADGASYAPTPATQIVIEPGKDNQPVITAGENKGMGTWLSLFGKDVAETQKSISLFVPGSSKKVAGMYKTDLVWTLTNTPAE